MVRMLPKLEEFFINCSWKDDILDVVRNFMVSSNALKNEYLELNEYTQNGMSMWNKQSKIQTL